MILYQSGIYNSNYPMLVTERKAVQKVRFAKNMEDSI